jgi:uncharacterized membrane protein YoaK (UPF0700 family)
MKSTRLILTLLILSNGTLQMFSYLNLNQVEIALVWTGLSVLWGISIWKDWRWGDTLGLFGFFAFLIGGIYLGAEIWLSLTSAVLTLATWDLSDFFKRLGRAEHVPRRKELVKQHLIRLGFALGAGLSLSLLSLNVQLTLSFGLVLAFGVLLLISLRQVIHRLLP